MAPLTIRLENCGLNVRVTQLGWSVQAINSSATKDQWRRLRRVMPNAPPDCSLASEDRSSLRNYQAKSTSTGLLVLSAPVNANRNREASAKKSAKTMARQNARPNLPSVARRRYRAFARNGGSGHQPITKPTPCQCQNAAPTLVEEGKKLRADWRVPRPDGKLRPVDRVVLRHLRVGAAQAGSDTTRRSPCATSASGVRSAIAPRRMRCVASRCSGW
jgi:hypothetical protein